MRRVLFLFLAVAAVLSAQNRLSDKDVESLMKNLREDAKAFRPVFSSDVHKSAIRKTSREKDAKALALRFEKQTAAMAEKFKKNRTADTELQAVRDTAQQLDALVHSLSLGGQTLSRWQRIQGDLNQIYAAFNLPPSQASLSAAYSSAQACVDAVGSARASRLVDQCMEVSPATHPPCNARNECSLIVDEIKRGCALLEGHNPLPFCSQYR